MTRKKKLRTGTDTASTAETIIQITQLQSLPIQNKNYSANNKHFADLSDSTSKTIHTSSKKLCIGYIKKTKEKNQMIIIGMTVIII